MRSSSGLYALSLTLILATGLAAAGESGVTVLDESSLWRYHLTWCSEQVKLKSGETVFADGIMPVRRAKVAGKHTILLTKMAKPRRTAPPPAGWKTPEFDDSGWPRYRWRLGRAHRSTSMLCLRARFQVERPADLKLSLGFRGGAAVFVNGKELKRAHLPKSKLESGALAEDYPREAYLNPEGFLLRRGFGDPKKYAENFKKRLRRIDSLVVPASALKKGLNVVAIQMHRAVAPEYLFLGKCKTGKTPKHVWWARLGAEDVKLTGPAGGAVLPNTGRPSGLQVWSHPVVERVRITDGGDRMGKPRVRIIGARGGSFSGQVVAGSKEAIRGLGAKASALSGGGGSIPASAIKVRYGLLDGPRVSRRYPAVAFSGLDPVAPAEVPVDKRGGGAVRPVWVTVHVPRDAKPGEYTGKLTVSAQGAKSVEVPLSLKVIDWLVPPSTEFFGHVGMVQSPDSLAMKYGVEMWSEPHWKLVEESLRLMGTVGNKSVYLPLLAKTHFGNEQSMVRWIKKPDGSYKHDFSIAERYLKLVVKHMGKVPIVCLYCWEPAVVTTAYPAHLSAAQRAQDGTRYCTVVDPASKKLSQIDAPPWGTPEAEKFWRPVMEGMRQRIEKLGMGKSLMIGVAGDYVPSPAAAKTITTCLPAAKWVCHTHIYRTKLYDRPVGYLAVVWGMASVRDPSSGRFYGWKNPLHVVGFPRYGCGVFGPGLKSYRPLAAFRVVIEGAMVSAGGGSRKGRVPGAHGVGRLGVDFWQVLKDKRGRVRGSVVGTYNPWGSLHLRNAVEVMLSPGAKGPVATARLEMMRENLQVIEARIFIERVLTDPTRRAKLGEPLARKCQEILDERIRHILRTVRQGTSGYVDPAWFPASCWQERLEELYSAAAEVAGKTGGK